MLILKCSLSGSVLNINYSTNDFSLIQNFAIKDFLRLKRSLSELRYFVKVCFALRCWRFSIGLQCSRLFTQTKLLFPLKTSPTNSKPLEMSVSLLFKSIQRRKSVIFTGLNKRRKKDEQEKCHQEGCWGSNHTLKQQIWNIWNLLKEISLKKTSAWLWFKRRIYLWKWNTQSLILFWYSFVTESNLESILMPNGKSQRQFLFLFFPFVWWQNLSWSSEHIY